MKKLLATTAALLMLSAAPALAMSCCGNGKAGMCAKGGMAPNAKGKKGGCCCGGMSGNMSKRA